MLRAELVLTLPGRPAPKGSLKCIGRGGRHQLIEDNARTKPWRQTIVTWARKATNHADPGQPVGVAVTITIERPKSVSRVHATTRNTYDVDKLARLVLDALQDAKVLPDDAQVVELLARKAYIDGPLPDALPYPGALIRVYPIRTVTDPILDWS